MWKTTAPLKRLEIQLMWFSPILDFLCIHKHNLMDWTFHMLKKLKPVAYEIAVNPEQPGGIKMGKRC